MKRVLARRVVAILLLGCCFCESLQGFAVLMRAALSVQVSFTEPTYGVPARGASLVFKGEPLEIDLGIANPRRGPKAGVERDWLGRISMILKRGGLFDKGGAVAAVPHCAEEPLLLRNERAQFVDDYIVLDDSFSKLWYRCRTDVNTGELEAGTYTIWAQWHGDVSDPRFEVDYASRQPAALELEVRELETQADQLDLAVQRAWKALNAVTPDPEWALRVADAALRRAPLSAVVLVVRARAREELRLCRQARADWQLAAAIFEAAGDPLDRRDLRLSQDERRQIAHQWLEKARLLQCP